MTRYVLDTNVIVSALLFGSSPPGRAFAQASERGRILISDALLNELSDVLGREKFNRYVTRGERHGFLEALVRESDMIEITESVRVCRDPEDDFVLELAVNGNASCIITGDADLLVLNPFRGVQIPTTSDFLDVAEPGRSP